MKLALLFALAVGAILIVGLAMGYSIHVGTGYVQITGPARISPFDAEAEANSPECHGLRERFPEKPSYTMEEFDARTKATMDCIEAKMRYISNKVRAR